MDLLADIGVALLFGLALYGALWALSVTVLAPSGTPARDLHAHGEAVARAADPGWTAASLAGLIAVFAALGAATLIGDADLPAFVINREGTIPTFFSSALLLVAGGLSLLLGARGRAERWWLIWGLLLIALGVDEAAEVHERLEVRLDVPAPVVLAPLGIVAAVAYLQTLAEIPAGSLVRRLYLAGAAAWATALLSDVVHGVNWKSVLEETLEMSGSASILLALLLLVREK